MVGSFNVNSYPSIFAFKAVISAYPSRHSMALIGSLKGVTGDPTHRCSRFEFQMKTHIDSLLSLRFLLSVGLVLTLIFAFFTLLKIDDVGAGAAERSHFRKTFLKQNLIKRSALQADTSEMTFVCDNGTVTDAVYSDGYCDCKDGSDEVLTDACSYAVPQVRLFNCRDEFNSTIYSSRVNDFVCDCSNGLDEYDTLTDCVVWKKFATRNV